MRAVILLSVAGRRSGHHSPSLVIALPVALHV
jgi:hypothetical protein